jgi:hypothetical protein
MPVTVDDDKPLCLWGNCTHSPNAHGRDHCHACDCEKPPPPPPGAPTSIEEARRQAEELEKDVDVTYLQECTGCAAAVYDREKHVTRHERDINTLTNLVISISGLDRRVDRMLERLDELEERFHSHVHATPDEEN